MRQEEKKEREREDGRPVLKKELSLL